MSLPTQRFALAVPRQSCAAADARRLFLPLCLLLLLPACSHYRLGAGGTPAFATLYVAPIENHALLPQALALVATEIREALLKDGRIALTASPASADATLRVDLAGYDREVTAARSDDTGLARKFALNLRAVCTLTDNRTGRVLFENREIRVAQPVFTDSGQQQAEYQTLPLLAQALGAKVAHAILDVW